MWIIQSNYHSPDFYPSLERELLALVDGEKNLIANLANITSWIFHSFPEINWCGFYLWSVEDNQLILGPFQGLPACLRINPNQGVCGASFSQKKTLRVDDVDQFPGHIACDSSSRSELVIPLIKNSKMVGVLELDSPKLARFSPQDEFSLTRIVDKLAERIF
jgi:GAF domain-containing protein